jgi:hypothetical protein
MSAAAVSSLRRTTEPSPRCTNLVAALASVLNAALALAAAAIAIDARENPRRWCSLSRPPSDSSVSVYKSGDVFLSFEEVYITPEMLDLRAESLTG